ncbi:unnamed protein product [[Candida] boidinii]|nr:unnamed protein product [[Candida] boidinii]
MDLDNDSDSDTSPETNSNNNNNNSNTNLIVGNLNNIKIGYKSNEFQAKEKNLTQFSEILNKIATFSKFNELLTKDSSLKLILRSLLKSNSNNDDRSLSHINYSVVPINIFNSNLNIDMERGRFFSFAEIYLNSEFLFSDSKNKSLANKSKEDSETEIKKSSITDNKTATATTTTTDSHKKASSVSSNSSLDSLGINFSRLINFKVITTVHDDNNLIIRKIEPVSGFVTADDSKVKLNLPLSANYWSSLCTEYSNGSIDSDKFDKIRIIHTLYLDDDVRKFKFQKGASIISFVWKFELTTDQNKKDSIDCLTIGKPLIDNFISKYIENDDYNFSKPTLKSKSKAKLYSGVVPSNPFFKVNNNGFRTISVSAIPDHKNNSINNSMIVSPTDSSMGNNHGISNLDSSIHLVNMGPGNQTLDSSALLRDRFRGHKRTRSRSLNGLDELISGGNSNVVNDNGVMNLRHHPHHIMTNQAIPTSISGATTAISTPVTAHVFPGNITPSSANFPYINSPANLNVMNSMAVGTSMVPHPLNMSMGNLSMGNLNVMSYNNSNNASLRTFGSIDSSSPADVSQDNSMIQSTPTSLSNKKKNSGVNISNSIKSKVLDGADQTSNSSNSSS